ncbi:hypothetical protein KM043_005777 [Ampulex compressa]|nr:hypothetical protein KM043_005777 [Ampulex compressa]
MSREGPRRIQKRLDSRREMEQGISMDATKVHPFSHAKTQDLPHNRPSSDFCLAIALTGRKRRRRKNQARQLRMKPRLENYDCPTVTEKPKRAGAGRELLLGPFRATEFKLPIPLRVTDNRIHTSVRDTSVNEDEDERLRSEALERLLMVEGDNEAALRSKRTIGILRELFPEVTKMIDNKVNTIVGHFIRVLGPILLQNVLGGNNANGGGSSAAIASSFEEEDEDDFGSSSKSSSGGVSVSLPTYPPDEEEVTEAPVSSSTAGRTAVASAGATGASTVTASADSIVENVAGILDRGVEDVTTVGDIDFNTIGGINVRFIDNDVEDVATVGSVDFNTIVGINGRVLDGDVEDVTTVGSVDFEVVDRKNVGIFDSDMENVTTVGSVDFKVVDRKNIILDSDMEDTTTVGNVDFNIINRLNGRVLDRDVEDVTSISNLNINRKNVGILDSNMENATTVRNAYLDIKARTTDSILDTDIYDTTIVNTKFHKDVDKPTASKSINESPEETTPVGIFDQDPRTSVALASDDAKIKTKISLKTADKNIQDSLTNNIRSDTANLYSKNTIYVSLNIPSTIRIVEPIEDEISSGIENTIVHPFAFAIANSIPRAFRGDRVANVVAIEEANAVADASAGAPARPGASGSTTTGATAGITVAPGTGATADDATSRTTSQEADVLSTTTDVVVGAN